MIIAILNPYTGAKAVSVMHQGNLFTVWKLVLPPFYINCNMTF